MVYDKLKCIFWDLGCIQSDNVSGRIRNIIKPGDLIVNEDPSAWGNVVDGYPVCSSNVLDCMTEKHIVIIPDEKYEMCKGELIKRGYRENIDYFPESAIVNDCKDKIIPVELGPGKIAIHLHLYYLDLLDEFYADLQKMPYVFDLLVDVNDKAYKDCIEQKFHQLPMVDKCIVRVFENRGRDIAPFFVGFADVINDYDFVAHIHSKKSLFTGREQKDWRRHCLDILMGDSDNIRGIFDKFKRNNKVGMIFPEAPPNLTYNAFHWLSNKRLGCELLARLNMEIPSTDYFYYSAGSMFWARKSALKKIFDLRLSWTDFPVEAGQNDGTLAHALERVIPMSVNQSGFDCLVKEGRNLYKLNYSGKNYNMYFDNGYDYLLCGCKNHDIISFDIFDTLVMRKMLRPDFIFKLIEVKVKKDVPEFYRCRKGAEKIARRKLQRDCSLKDIYIEMKKICGISEELCDNLRSMEIEEELKSCVPRKSMVECLKLCKMKGKKVILVSDMYLESHDIKKILRKCGINDKYYDKLYVSSETNLRKDNGDIWKYISENNNEKKRILHIGDNALSDWQLARNNGINSYHVMSAENLLFTQREFIPLADELFSNMSLSTAMQLGMILSHEKSFSDPFFMGDSNGKFLLTTYEDWGYAVYGPVLLRYILWLISESHKDDCQQLLFMARDGYFLKPLYEKICSLLNIKPLPNVYFLASRRSLSLAAIRNKEDVYEVLGNYFNGSIRDCLKARFDVDVVDDTVGNIRVVLPGKDLRMVEKVVDEYLEIILDRAKKERGAYESYINRLNFSMDKKTGIVDIGYAGSLQLYLQKMLDVDNYIGYYFATNINSKFEGVDKPIKGCFANLEQRDTSKSSVWRYHLYFESVLSSPDGQFIRFKKDGSPVFAQKEIAQKHIEDLRGIHKGVFDYCKDMIETYGEEVEQISLDDDFINRWVSLFVHHQELMKKELRVIQSVESYYTGTGILDVFSIYKNQ